MKHEIIKTEKYLVVVDDIDFESVYYIDDTLAVREMKIHDPEYWSVRTDYRSIKAHLPLNNSPILEGVDLLPPLEDDVDQAQNEFEKLFNTKIIGDKLFTNKLITEVAEHYFIVGFTEAKQTYKYTEEDLRMAYEYGNGRGGLGLNNDFNLFLKNLQQPKLPVAFTSQLEPLYKTTGSVKGRYGSGVKIANERAGLTMTTTNSEGQTVWIGTYQY